MRKPQIAFFDFACCEGCQLTVLQLEEQLLDVLEHVDVVTWREAMTEESSDYDIAFCEGSIARNEDIGRIERIRDQAKVLVTLGSCASIGCHNALKNKWEMEEMLDLVYGEEGKHFDTVPARPISAVVDVDYQTYGCPVSIGEFVEVVKHILTGQQYDPPNQPVCVECKLADNQCVYEKGEVCLGPITRCGCGAICTTYGEACQGCRGMMASANPRAALRALTRGDANPIMRKVIEAHGLTEQEIFEKIRVYNNWPQLDFEELPVNDD